MCAYLSLCRHTRIPFKARPECPTNHAGAVARLPHGGAVLPKARCAGTMPEDEIQTHKRSHAGVDARPSITQ